MLLNIITTTLPYVIVILLVWWADNLNPRTSALVFGKQFCELIE
jgi:hypothetical protein